MSDERYWIHKDGQLHAIKSSCVCKDCGAFVYDMTAHDAFHDRVSAAVGPWGLLGQAIAGSEENAE